MKQIKYQVKVTYLAKDQTEVVLETFASTASELLKNLDEVLNKKSKNWIMKLFGNN